MFEMQDLSAFVQVVLADIVMAGDNAVAVGLAAAALSPQLRQRAILIGIGLALVLRIAFALVAIQLLQIKGLLLLGGLLLLWVAWRMWKDISSGGEVGDGHSGPPAGVDTGGAAVSSQSDFLRALTTIVLADVSMSLDNVLVVAAVARHSPEIMAFGLILSVILMGVAATYIARIIHRYPMVAYIGIAVIIFAAIRMIWEDGHNFLPAAIPPLPSWLGAAHPPA
jgi:YjbE family integral membrane protein